MNKLRSALFIVAITALLSGCQSVPANKPAVTYAPPPDVPPPTSLVITVDGGEISEAEYKARRDDLIAYLIERGYIQSEADLVTDDANAQRMIQATLAADGGFKISVYSLDSQAVSEQPAVAYSIPASYYGDYYYYGFEPVPFYGYTSWPAYYPIYPAYPICAPVAPIASYCAPAHWHRNSYCPPQYLNCGYAPKPHYHQWPDRQQWSNWSHHDYPGQRNLAWSRPHGAAVNYAAQTVPAMAPGRTGGRDEWPHSPATRSHHAVGNPSGGNLAENSPGVGGAHRSPPYASNRGSDGNNRNRNTPWTRNYDRRPAPQSTAQTPPPVTVPQRSTRPGTTLPPGVDGRVANTSPQVSTPNRRYTPSTNQHPENRARGTATPAPHSDSPHPANVANTGRPMPARHNYTPASAASTPRPANVANTSRPMPGTAPAPRNYTPSHSNPAPRHDAPAPSRSTPTTPTRQTASSVHESSSPRSANEH